MPLDPGFGEKAEFMASAEREPILGIWGLYPSGTYVQWQISPWWVMGSVQGQNPMTLTNFQQMRYNFLIKFILNMVKYSNH